MAARCWASPRTEPIGYLRPAPPPEPLQADQQATGWTCVLSPGLIATADETPDLRIILKTLPWKQESSKFGPGVKTECLNAALFRIWPNNCAPVRQHLYI